MPAARLKAYVRRPKYNTAAADAFREAVTRPTMRLVAIKTQTGRAYWRRTGREGC